MLHAALMATLYLSALASAAPAADCGDEQTQTDMNLCAARDYADVDRQLNEVYREYRKRLSDDQKRQLKDAQRAWIEFRDRSCDFESSGVEGGSVHPLIRNSCLAGMTRARIEQLDVLARCEEGDLSCPAPK